MKVPIDDYACIDLDAPVLPAYETVVNGSVRWLVWCDHCVCTTGMDLLKGIESHTATTPRAPIGRPGTTWPLPGHGADAGNRPAGHSKGRQNDVVA
jgi:hypothetical protein